MTIMAKAELGPLGVQTLLAFDMDMNSAPSDDPIAYCMGFMHGYGGDPLVLKGEKKKDLAKAYIAGHRLGREVKAGRKPMPVWAKLQQPK